MPNVSSLLWAHQTAFHPIIAEAVREALRFTSSALLVIKERLTLDWQVHLAALRWDATTRAHSTGLVQEYCAAQDLVEVLNSEVVSAAWWHRNSSLLVYALAIVEEAWELHACDHLVSALSEDDVHQEVASVSDYVVSDAPTPSATVSSVESTTRSSEPEPPTPTPPPLPSVSPPQPADESPIVTTPLELESEDDVSVSPVDLPVSKAPVAATASKDLQPGEASPKEVSFVPVCESVKTDADVDEDSSTIHSGGDTPEDPTSSTAIDEITRNSMARRIQSLWRLYAGSYDEINRRLTQHCVQAIANLNWKYYGSGYYQGPAGDFYSDIAARIVRDFDPYDDECSYLAEHSSRRWYQWWLSVVDEQSNNMSTTFQLAYLEARGYLGQELTNDDLYSSERGKPSPWLDAILAKSGKNMSDWKFYFE